MQDSLSNSASMLTLTSPAFNHGTTIPAKYTCKGDNTVPPLNITDVDANARSLALVMDDPDATIGTFDHWIKWNIPPETQVIEEGKEPQGIAGKGSAENLTYMGPCPKSGTHRYRFKLYSLDAELDLAEGATKADLEKMMAGHILQQTELMGTFTI
jgi:Raf kinase inhibitor-like YbhB/YbcL family protein